MTDDTRKERGLCELYAEDPERADALVFGRVANPDRRGFLRRWSRLRRRCPL